LHGGMNDAHMWDLFAPILASRYRVIAPDARGHGQSDWSMERQYTVEFQTADVTQLLAVLGCEQVSIVGSSLGGWTGYHVAAQFPQLVKKLVVVDVSPEIMTAGRARVHAFSKKENGSVSFEDVLAAQLALFRGDSGHFVRASVERNIMLMPDGTVSWRFDGEGIAAGGVGSRDIEGEWRLLERIAAPTLLVRGAESEILTRELAERVCQTIPHVGLVEVPGAGHPVPIDQPARRSCPSYSTPDPLIAADPLGGSRNSSAPHGALAGPHQNRQSVRANDIRR
jgi:pimeloyl-ACP methyl ester carboxylesterase